MLFIKDFLFTVFKVNGGDCGGVSTGDKRGVGGGESNEVCRWLISGDTKRTLKQFELYYFTLPTIE